MIHVNGLGVSLDRKEKDAGLDFISHAHSDHTSSARSSKSVLASQETARLLEAIRGISVASCGTVPDGLRMIDAGHILGSKQLVAEDKISGTKTVYTGDFQMQRTRACKSIQIEEADTVIMDSTYFQDGLGFGGRDEVEYAMQKWTEDKLAGGIVLFGVYALGKAQEIISILNERDILPIVSKKVGVVSKVYRQSGVPLDYASAYEESREYEELLNGNFVAVVENNLLPIMSTAISELYNKRVYTAVATGFANMMKFNTDVQFPLSDHADLQQCIEYLDAAQAKRVYTYGANKLDLADSLASKGYNAMPFERGLHL